MSPHLHATRRNQTGMSLIEIMVGIAIALIASVGVLQMYAANDSARRGTLGGSDATQTGTLSSYNIAGIMQQIGGGMAVTPRSSSGGISGPLHLLGCTLSMKVGGTQLFGSALSAPFDSVPTNLRLVPAMIIDGGSGSDVLVAMGANSESANLAFSVDIRGDLTAVLPTRPPLGIYAGDALLMFQRQTTAPGTCQVFKVDNSYSVTTDYVTQLGNSAPSYGSLSTRWIPLNSGYGNPTTTDQYDTAVHLGQNPYFRLFGVDSQYRLLQYDLLSAGNSSDTTKMPNPSSIAENVYMIKFAYGLDNGAPSASGVPGTAGDGIVDDWAPASTAGWRPSDLTVGDVATEAKIHQIVALRYAIVVRSAEPVRDQNVTQLKLFSAFSSAGYTLQPTTITLTGADRNFLYHVYEGLIPVRNFKYY